MCDSGVNHTHMAPQVKKAELIGARTSLYSGFDAVKRVEAFPSRNLIKVHELLSRNQVYAEKEEFDFVLVFIRAHTNCR